MGLAGREKPRGRVNLTSMFSLDTAAVGKDGYREIFQAGEALNGRPLIERQHPHNLFMQLAAVWRVPINESTGFTLAGAPGADPSLRPPTVLHPGSPAGKPPPPPPYLPFSPEHLFSRR